MTRKLRSRNRPVQNEPDPCFAGILARRTADDGAISATPDISRLPGVRTSSLPEESAV